MELTWAQDIKSLKKSQKVNEIKGVMTSKQDPAQINFQFKVKMN